MHNVALVDGGYFSPSLYTERGLGGEVLSEKI
jgi:hypothetical protein